MENSNTDVVSPENQVNGKWAEQFAQTLLRAMPPQPGNRPTVAEKTEVIDTSRLTLEDELPTLEAAVGGDFKNRDGKLFHVANAMTAFQTFSISGSTSFVLRFFVTEFEWQDGRDGDPVRKSRRDFFTDARSFMADHERVLTGSDWPNRLRREACEAALKPAAAAA